MADFDRVERKHFVGQGTQRLIADPGRLDLPERVEIPPATLELFELWDERRAAIPESLGAAAGDLASREAVLERAAFDDRVYWTVRLVPRGQLEALGRPCLGASGSDMSRGDCPEPLGWLATLGRCSLVAEQSGSADWGRKLGERRSAGQLPYAFLEDWSGEDVVPLPEGSDEWLELYEADGDVLYADVTNDRLTWLGGEWTGEPLTTLDLGWQEAMEQILRSLLAGEWLRPTDL